MLSKKQRINRKDFTKVSVRSKATHSLFLTLRCNKKSNDYVARFSVVVSKKVAARSTERNRIRRRIYSILRNLSGSIRKGSNCIFYCKKGIQGRTYNEFEQEILFLLKKARVL